VTYPDLCVATALNEYYVPVQINVDQSRDLTRKFKVIWTPNINVLDSSENLCYRVEGWLPASEYSAMLMIAHGHYFLCHKRYKNAGELFQKVWDKFPHSTFAPEALYYLGVSGYMESHKVENLTSPWRILQGYCPQSTWAIRSSIL